MPFSLQPFSCGNRCTGHRWEITNESFLAKLVARLVLGYYRHVTKILGAIPSSLPAGHNLAAYDRAIARVAPPASEPLRYHRDGWIFQLIAWIAAHRLYGNLGTLSIPHGQPADKGFDGLLLLLASSGASPPAGLIISEEKATQNSRDTIRDEVWPDFQSCEDGNRDTEILNEATALLERAFSPAQADVILQEAFWILRRGYRVCITVGATHDTAAGRASLFKGFDGVVQGDLARRRGETLRLDDLRAWMDHFCWLVSNELTVLRG